MLSVKEFAERTGLTEEQVKTNIRKRLIKAKKRNGVYEISEKPDQWLANRQKTQANTTDGKADKSVKRTSGGPIKDVSSNSASQRMREISDNAIKTIQNVFEKSFRGILDNLQKHAETFPSDMRSQLKREVESQFKKHANLYAEDFNKRVEHIIKHISDFESRISEEKLKTLEDRITDLAKTQLSEKTLDQYYKSRVESQWKNLSEKMQPLELLHRIDKRIEDFESRIESLSTRSQLEAIQEQLASEIISGKQTHRFLKFSYFGIGIIVVLSIINLVMIL